jgi:hypothetical protein
MDRPERFRTRRARHDADRRAAKEDPYRGRPHPVDLSHCPAQVRQVDFENPRLDIPSGESAIVDEPSQRPAISDEIGHSAEIAVPLGRHEQALPPRPELNPLHQPE